MKSTGNTKFIFICTGSDCKQAGSKKIIKEVKEYLKQEKKQAGMRIIKTKCMDYCKKAPNAVINNSLFHKTSFKALKPEL